MPEIPTKETLTVEFKSDRKRLSDDDLVATTIAMANTEGGAIYLGVEDDGTATGLHPAHQPPDGIAPLVGNRTVPSVQVRIETLAVEGKTIAKISVPKVNQVVATTAGSYFKRRLKHDGTPENVPILPHDIPARLSQLGAQDVSRQPVAGSKLADLDDAERIRLRQFIERNQGDAALASLSNEELDGVLGLTSRDGETISPTLAGLLLIGKEEALRQFVPTHEVAFQVLEREEVRANEFTRAPLLRVVEWLDNMMAPWNREDEVQVGLFRVPIPRVEKRSFREAVANALTHRDYTRIGAIHVRLQDDALTVSNPGGFVEGVTLDNLLTTEPRPRNPWLADVFKRLGLVERTGRGVDLIYRGLLRYGRARPDYSRSDSSSVVLRMPTSDADLSFLRLIVEEENRRWENRGAVSVTVEQVGARPAGQTARTSRIVETALAVSKALDLESALGEGSTDSNVPMNLGIPAITIGGGGIGSGAHSLNETFEARDSWRGTQRALLLAIALARSLE